MSEISFCNFFNSFESIYNSEFLTNFEAKRRDNTEIAQEKKTT